MNTEVTWNDQSLADAIIEKCKGMSIKIFPETALQVAGEIRSNCEGNDIISITSAVKQAISNLLNIDNESGIKVGQLDILLNKIAAIRNKYSQEDDDIQARAEVHGVMIAAQDSLMAETVQKIKENLDSLEAFQSEAQTIYDEISDPTELNRLKQEVNRLGEINTAVKSNPNSTNSERVNANRDFIMAEEAHRALLLKRKRKKATWDSKKTEANVMKTKILMLDMAYEVLDKKLYSPEGYDRSGYRKAYFDAVLTGIKKTKSFYSDARDGIIIPDVSEFERHEFRYLGRDAKTPGVQEGVLNVNKFSISLDDIRESPSYDVLTGPPYNLSERQISTIVDNLNYMEDTWQKGQLIFALLDPPAAIGTIPSINTILSKKPAGGQRGVSRSREIKYNQSVHRSIDDFMELVNTATVNEMLEEVDTNGKAYWTEGRKQGESLDPKIHWAYLSAFSSENVQDRYGRTAHDKYIESLPPEVIRIVDRTDLPNSTDENYKEALEALSPGDKAEAQIKNKVLDAADKFAATNLLNDDKTINNVIHNQNTPSWLLMKLMNILSNIELRNVAMSRLSERNIEPVLDPEAVGDDKYLRDGFGNIVFNTENATTPATLAQGRVRTNFNKRGQGANPQTESLKTQMTNNENQIQQLNNQINQIRQTNENLRKNMDTLKGEQVRAEEANKQTINNLAQSNPVQPTQPLATPMAKFKVVYKKNA